MELQQRPERYVHNINSNTNTNTSLHFYATQMLTHFLSASEFRVLENTRATTMPPFAASTWVPLHVQHTVQKALLAVYKTHQHLLNNNGFSKFVEIDNEKYDDIREVISFVQEMRAAQKWYHSSSPPPSPSSSPLPSSSSSSTQDKPNTTTLWYYILI